MQQLPNVSGFGLVNCCSLAKTVKQSVNRPDAELLIELKNLIRKF